MPTTQPDKNRILIGKIATAHGIRGLVKILCFTKTPELLNGRIYTSQDEDTTLDITLKNKTAKHYLAKIEGINDRSEALSLRGTKLYIERSALPPLEDGEVYAADITGLPAMDKSGNKIGTIVAIANFGASDLLEIQPEDGGDSFYLPFTDDNVLEIKKEKLIISIPGGLLD